MYSARMRSLVLSVSQIASATLVRDVSSLLLFNAVAHSNLVERPDFLRRTKHSTNGEEDSKFSYVVFRRGARPASSHHPNPHTLTKLGPMSEVSSKLPIFTKQPEEVLDERPVFDRMPVTASPAVIEDETAATEEMRQEAFSWPRIVAPPMKRSGHVVFDVCAPSGQISLWFLDIPLMIY